MDLKQSVTVSMTPSKPESQDGERLTGQFDLAQKTRQCIFQFRYEPEAKPVWHQSSYRLTGLKEAV
jgi:hypothetical protein